jgi:hypothetical protein
MPQAIVRDVATMMSGGRSEATLVRSQRRKHRFDRGPATRLAMAPPRVPVSVGRPVRRLSFYDVAETFVVECPICQRAWEIWEKVQNVPRRAWIRLPPHDQIDDHGEVRRGAICPGGTRSALAGLPAGTRQSWETEVRARFGDRARPPLLDGADVRLVTSP